MVSVYYHLLVGHSEQFFPWKIIWKQKIPSRVAFFVWTIALGKCPTIDNFRKRKICIFWIGVICASVIVKLLTIYSFIVRLLWSCGNGFWFIWSLLGYANVCCCWQGQFGRHHNGDIWIVVPHCLMWCIWKERNSRCFEVNERSMPNLKLLFLEPYWTGS